MGSQEGERKGRTFGAVAHPGSCVEGAVRLMVVSKAAPALAEIIIQEATMRWSPGLRSVSAQGVTTNAQDTSPCRQAESRSPVSARVPSLKI